MHPTPRLAAALLVGSGLGWPLLAQADLVEGQPRQPRTAQLLLQPRLPPERRARQRRRMGAGLPPAPGVRLQRRHRRLRRRRHRPARPQARLRRRQRRNQAAAGRRLRRGSQDDYAKLGLTAKARVSNSLLKVGALHFKSPLVSANDTRLLPELFPRRAARRAGDRRPDPARRAPGPQQAEQLQRLPGVQRQPHRRAQRCLRLRRRRLSPDPGADRQPAPGSAKDITTDLRRLGTHPRPRRDSARSRATCASPGPARTAASARLDNPRPRRPLRPAPAPTRWRRLPAGSAATIPYPYIAGRPVPVNFIQIGDFEAIDERSLATALTYDFGALGLPGLSFMSRYVSGDNVAMRGQRR